MSSCSCSIPPRREDAAQEGPGITDSDILVINKIDIAQYVRTNLDVMEADAHRVREDRPVVLTNSLTGVGVDELHRQIMTQWNGARTELIG
ncbi:hypothetical protein OL239_13060 [Arthrobacter sp. ATA002]|uniref:GTP-binding protein n=1 Tax=Arthrobacter sp. ATA002 TaxID=2991715 RepID=UPI0022A6E3C1|nr:GTP-binding protein [Arthrobacter sp. ATA002]WAP50899.1 hypothetical protein OL239_13060 [Arthrobacter sp. ATA002]